MAEGAEDQPLGGHGWVFSLSDLNSSLDSRARPLSSLPWCPLHARLRGDKRQRHVGTGPTLHVARRMLVREQNASGGMAGGCTEPL